MTSIFAVFLCVGCGEGAEDDAGSSTYFHYYMSQPELYEVAKANGLPVNEKSGKKGLLNALGEAFGCRCQENIECGYDSCGNICGGCDEGMTCFGNACVDIEEGSYYGFTPMTENT